MKVNLIVLIALFLFSSFPAFAVEANQEEDPSLELEAEPEINDPLEPVNRAIFKFNSIIDKYALRPVAIGYRYVVPAWGRQRVTNFFYNLSEPVTAINSTLQADPENAFTSTWRFLFNSTIGVGGLFDAADDLGLKRRPEDFGQTLGKWGYADPPYIVIPFLGPSSVRDGFGMVVDYYSNPFYNGMVIDDETTKIAMTAVNVVDKRTNALPLTDDVEKNALDPYVTYRSYYLQNRTNKINNGENDNKPMSNY